MSYKGKQSERGRDWEFTIGKEISIRYKKDFEENDRYYSVLKCYTADKILRRAARALSKWLKKKGAISKEKLIIFQKDSRGSIGDPRDVVGAVSISAKRNSKELKASRILPKDFAPRWFEISEDVLISKKLKDVYDRVDRSLDWKVQKGGHEIYVEEILDIVIERFISIRTIFSKEFFNYFLGVKHDFYIVILDERKGIVQTIPINFNGALNETRRTVPKDIPTIEKISWNSFIITYNDWRFKIRLHTDGKAKNNLKIAFTMEKFPLKIYDISF